MRRLVRAHIQTSLITPRCEPLLSLFTWKRDELYGTLRTNEFILSAAKSPRHLTHKYARAHTHTHTHTQTTSLPPLSLPLLPLSSFFFFFFFFCNSSSRIALLLPLSLFLFSSLLPTSPPPLPLPPRGVSQGAWVIQQLFVWRVVDRACGYLGAQKAGDGERGDARWREKEEIMAEMLGGRKLWMSPDESARVYSRWWLFLFKVEADATAAWIFRNLSHSTLELYKKSLIKTVKVTLRIPRQEKTPFFLSMSWQTDMQEVI